MHFLQAGETDVPGETGLLRDSGYLKMQEPVSPELLQRIRRGVSLSKRIELEHIELMEEQELLD
jgi:hypothetical protein